MRQRIEFDVHLFEAAVLIRVRIPMHADRLELLHRMLDVVAGILERVVGLIHQVRTRCCCFPRIILCINR